METIVFPAEIYNKVVEMTLSMYLKMGGKIENIPSYTMKLTYKDHNKGELLKTVEKVRQNFNGEPVFKCILNDGSIADTEYAGMFIELEAVSLILSEEYKK